MTRGDAGAPQADHVIGEFRRDQLSAALAATHRAGFGPQARVIDGARNGAARQLEHAGLRVLDDDPAPDALLIVVTAPGRTGIVADLFRRLGAVAVHLAGRRGTPAPVGLAIDATLPDIRIGRDEATGAEA